ncbi:MAG: hypothetical protein INR69_00305 [Mucilaginibacter polytrichastri]|nr:hypothetical protein [Mucilaginibacter polytrichastri]
MAFAKRFGHYAKLAEKIGKESAEDLLQFIAEHVKAEIDRSKESLATMTDLLELKTELVEKMGNIKADTIKWMFIFWIGQVAATFGFILLFLKN